MIWAFVWTGLPLFPTHSGYLQVFRWQIAIDGQVAFPVVVWVSSAVLCPSCQPRERESCPAAFLADCTSTATWQGYLVSVLAFDASWIRESLHIYTCLQVSLVIDADVIPCLQLYGSSRPSVEIIWLFVWSHCCQLRRSRVFNFIFLLWTQDILDHRVRAVLLNISTIVVGLGPLSRLWKLWSQQMCGCRTARLKILTFQCGMTWLDSNYLWSTYIQNRIGETSFVSSCTNLLVVSMPRILEVREKFRFKFWPGKWPKS